ncbi:alpha/beta hydrolase, partial [Flavobacteriaceae bacterium]|nr:alpha/beta hydrolase [Flavobacteriaceae bacterium]
MAIKGLFLKEQLTLYFEEIEQLTARALKTPKLALTQSIRAMSTRVDHQQTLKNFLGQKHIVAGDQDPLFPLTLSRDMALNTGAKLHTYSGSHMGWLEAPELILTILGSERIPSASN